MIKLKIRIDVKNYRFNSVNNKHTCALITDANMCATLAAPADGTRSSDDLMFPVAGTLDFACNSGFSLTGSATVTCQADGTFDNAAPTCGMSSF